MQRPKFSTIFHYFQEELKLIKISLCHRAYVFNDGKTQIKLC